MFSHCQLDPPHRCLGLYFILFLYTVFLTSCRIQYPSIIHTVLWIFQQWQPHKQCGGWCFCRQIWVKKFLYPGYSCKHVVTVKLKPPEPALSCEVISISWPHLGFSQDHMRQSCSKILFSFYTQSFKKGISVKRLSYTNTQMTLCNQKWINLLRYELLYGVNF